MYICEQLMCFIIYFYSKIVKNSNCIHVYERGAIDQVLQKAAKKVCPIPGCNAYIGNLEPDYATKFYVNRSQKRKRAYKAE